MKNEKFKKDKKEKKYEERVVSINRCSKVVKGGRNFSFSALVVVGDMKGNVGYGLGKANEVADAIRKGSNIAQHNVFKVSLRKTTIPHEMKSKFGGAKILILPASEGTGLIAGGAMRAVLELAGVRDVLAKSQGSNNPINVVMATIEALKSLKTRKQTMEIRGLN